MKNREICEQLKKLGQRIDALESNDDSINKSNCCEQPTLPTARELSDKAQLLTIDSAVAGKAGRARASIDASRNDNGFLGCVHREYSETSNTQVLSHRTTEQAFSNIRAGSADFSLIVGHGDQGLIITGTGQTVDGIEKYMSNGNQSSWSPHASHGIPGNRLVLFGCQVAGGTSGQRFIQRVANVVRKEVGAWTGNVWCSSSGVWGTGDFRIATPGKKLEVIEPPEMYEANKNMTNLRLQTVTGYDDISFDRVTRANFTPIGSIPEKSAAIRVEGVDVTRFLQLIDFENPFVTEDKPGSILVGQLTLTYKAKEEQEYSRTFRVLGYSLLQDVCFPTTYYNASNDLRLELQGAK